MDDAELRQALAALDAYNVRLESMTRQVRMLQLSLEETSKAAEAMRALAGAKEGDEVLVPLGASSFASMSVPGEKKVIVGVGSGVSVEKSFDDALAYMEAGSREISEALKKAVATLSEAEEAASRLTAAVEQEYSDRQRPQ
ncbi:MAG: prefoldin subunit alpha [Candidatus Methanoplasma sp.]|jgi:prefoldin alpha subunit|nr:prefoldin subunit alpha [Candidatus Methanoplasma sp.]